MAVVNTGWRKLVVAMCAASPAVVVGASCSDDCSGTRDCGSAVEVSWEPDALESADLVRVCVEDDCTEAGAPYVNEAGSNVHAPAWDGELPETPVEVRVDLLDADGVVNRSLETAARARGTCGCSTIRLEVDDGGRELRQG